MSIALLVTHAGDEAGKVLVPVAPEALFLERWLPGARALDLAWVPLMQTGFQVTPENRGALLGELARLRAWMVTALGDTAYELERLDALVHGLRALQLEPGVSAFLG